ncbi:sulfurtransferase [Halomicronema sp. CCY15110]|uniref:sulfurtransferase n=1 Tax=Halomicronema sp. CCY15110 TaxID=2767773 RepID=UPI0019517F1B|nr:sulfurtransferase [Halomicronema sp. CCY15110]
MNSSSRSLPTPLVDIQWLQAHLHDSNLIIVDCRFALGHPQQGRAEYLAAHIPGACYLDLNQDLSSPVGQQGGRHPLPNIDLFVSKLEGLGISSHPATPVIAYDATKGAFAARLWWLLRYLGHDAVAVLDGGFPAWQAAQLPLTTAVPERPPGQFSPAVQADWVADRSTVMAAQTEKSPALIDARSPERYRGEHEPIDPVAGAIPQALNFFWQTNLNEQGYFKPPAELAQLWQTMPTADASIYYCGSGVTACVNLLAQAVMHRPMPQLYVGGWSDWCSYESPSHQT